MKIKRYSFGFLILISIGFCFFLLATYISFSNRITKTDIEKTGLPILYIETNNSKPIKSKDKYLKADYKINDQIGKCEIRGRGNSTWDLKKKPYLLKFSKPEQFLDLPEARKWVLMANGGDYTNLRNAYATYLAKNVWNSFIWSPNYRYVNLYLNGRYEGLYQVYEKIEISNNKLNIKQINQEIEFNNSFIFVTNTRNTKPINFKSNLGIKFSMYSPKIISNQNKDILIYNLNKFEELLFSDNFKNSETGYRKYINIDSFIDWYLINEFTTNRDARFKDSCYLYYNATECKLNMGPIWDFDISCGNNSYEGNCYPEGYWIKNEAIWYKKLFEDPWFVEQVKNRWLEKQTELKESVNYIYSLSRKIKYASELNDLAWQNIGHFQWPHAIGWKNRKTYDDEVNYFIDWLNKRIEWLNNDIEKNL